MVARMVPELFAGYNNQGRRTDQHEETADMMPFAAMLSGLLLIGLGAWGYFGAELEHRSGTAWIPAGFGLALLLLGALALKAHLRKHAMHAAAAVGLIGFVGAVVMVLRKFGKDGNLESRGATAQLAMAVLCAVFVGLCVNSFIQARRRRRDEG